MYTTTDDPIRLWQFPNTLAGDTAVTIIVQCLMTWMIEMFIVNRDLCKGNLQPIGFISEPSSTERLSRWIRWFMLLDQSKELRKRLGSIRRKALYVLAQVIQALVVAFVSFCILFGPSVGSSPPSGPRSAPAATGSSRRVGRPRSSSWSSAVCWRS